ncbi:MAG: phosphopantetheine-binding protein [Bacteroidota bacterium]
MVAIDQVLDVLADSLDSSVSVREMDEDARLFGAVPELDSMAIVGVITSIEEKFGIRFEDDELDAEIFETVGSLIKQIAAKLEDKTVN